MNKAIMKKNYLIVVLLTFISITPTYSWNALGHRLVVQIAYDNMTPKAKKLFSRYNQALNTARDHRSFVGAGPWLDSLRYPNQRWIKPLHYVDIPFTQDSSNVHAASKPNAISAINAAVMVLRDSRHSLRDKGFSLRILLHVVGDIHQPMHAVSQFSRKHPKGDYGGNLIYLKNNPVATNLHAYWDNGGGWLTLKKRYKPAQFNLQLVRRAKRLERRFRCNTNTNLEPMIWAKESHQLAISKAYNIREGQKLSRAYHQMVGKVTQQRLALAGCRLAIILNRIA